MARLSEFKGLLIGLVIAIVVGVGAVGGVGWHFSNVLEDGALLVKHEDVDYNTEVVFLYDDAVTLASVDPSEEDGPWTKPGLWGLESASAYGRVAEVATTQGTQVTRAFTPVNGTFAPGDRAHMDSFTFDGDPKQAHGIDFLNVTYTSELGDFPAWFVPGESSTWVIFTHGRTADREEALRMLPTVTSLGYPALVITYRNDRGAPQSPDGYYRFGATEWRDLEAAVQHALNQGAERVVLAGFSMGGAITATFLRNSSLAGSAVAAILDAPVLDFGDLIDFGGERRNIASPMVSIGKTVAGIRFGIDWDAMDHVRHASEFDVPILLFHGDDDDQVHVRSSDAFAEARPDIVTYVRVPNATHVRAWNVDPVTYEGEVERFLSRVVGD